MGKDTAEMPFGDYAREGGDRVGTTPFSKQVEQYLDEHDAPLDVDAEGERSLKILLGILSGDIKASQSELKLLTALVAKLVPGVATRSADVKREDPGEYIGRAMVENEASFNKLRERAIGWAREAEQKTRAVMEALAGEAG